MTSDDASALPSTPELPRDGTTTRETQRLLLPHEPEAASASPQVRLSIDRVVGSGERAATEQDVPISPSVQPVPSVRVDKGIRVEGSGRTDEPATDASVASVIAPADAASRAHEDERSSEPPVWRRRSAHLAALYAAGSASTMPEAAPAMPRRARQGAGVAALLLLLAGAGYAAMGKRALHATVTPGFVQPTPLARAEATAAPSVELASGELPSGVSLEERRGAQGRARASVRSYYLDLTVEPTHAWIALDGKAAGMGRIQRKLPADGTEHILVVGAPGFGGRMFKFRDAPPPGQVVLERRVARFGRSGVEATDAMRCGPSGAPSAR